MIVCSCHRVTDHDVRQACAASGVTRACEIYRALGRPPQCGRCAPTMTALAKEVQQQGGGGQSERLTQKRLARTVAA